jgi:predicted heme/steroid binding protein
LRIDLTIIISSRKRSENCSQKKGKEIFGVVHYGIQGKCIILEELKKFSLNELGQFDGKNGKPAYICYSGKVYDVTGSIEWTEGDHLGHTAGQDLTESMEIAPHGSEILERMKVVGVLSEH